MLLGTDADIVPAIFPTSKGVMHMAVRNMRVKYVPGTYVKKRPSPAELAEQYILGWDETRLEMARIYSSFRVFFVNDRCWCD